MSPKRGDRAAPPPVGTEYDLRFATAADDDGWEDLARQAAPNLRRARRHPGQPEIDDDYVRGCRPPERNRLTPPPPG